MLIDNIKNIGKKLHIFKSRKITDDRSYSNGPSYGSRPDQFMKRYSSSSSSIVGAVFNKIAIDASAVTLQHVKVDEYDKTIEHIKSPTIKCFTQSANIDQTGIAFVHDLIYSALDEGVVAAVPIVSDDTDIMNFGYSVHNIRVGRITQWFPQHVTVRVYNEETGIEQDITIPKARCVILENPIAVVSSEASSTLSRLKIKLELLDTVEAHSTGSKLDIIIQVPQFLKNKIQKKDYAEKIEMLEWQLENSKYGIAYTDMAEKITQLNRPAMNILIEQIRDLTTEVYNQLGMTENILTGTASENEMLYYYNRVIDPILEFLVAEMNKKFLTEVARDQGHRFQYRRNPFKIVPVTEVANMGDTLVRNRIVTANEFRNLIGFNPSNDPNADKLENPNIADKNQNAEQPAKNISGGNKNEQQELRGSNPK